MSDTRADEPDIIEHLDAGRRLRLVTGAGAKRPDPGPELKAMLDDLRRRYRVDRGPAYFSS